jgi:hypothetical protein
MQWQKNHPESEIKGQKDETNGDYVVRVLRITDESSVSHDNIGFVTNSW